MNRISPNLLGSLVLMVILIGCGPSSSDLTATANVFSTGTAEVVATKGAIATGTAEVKASATARVNQRSTQRASNLATQGAEATATASSAMALPSVPAGWTLNVYDPFDNKSYWMEDYGTANDYTRAHVTVERGRYIWEAQAKQGFVYWSVPYYESIQKLSDFYVAVDARITTGEPASKYGLIFRSKDNDNTYVYEVTSKGFFHVFRYKNSSWVNITSQSSSAILRDDSVNQLAVLGVGDQFQFYINGKLVHNMKDDAFDKGGVGVIIELPYGGAKTIIEFDNFTVLTP